MVKGKMLQCLQHPCKLSMAPQKDADGGDGGGHADGTLSPTLTLGATVKKKMKVNGVHCVQVFLKSLIFP